MTVDGDQGNEVRWARMGFGEALRTATVRSGLSLSRIRERLNAMGVTVGESTLSYWQRGLRVPGPQAAPVVTALESLLGVPAGALVEALERQRSLGTSGHYSFRELRGDWGSVPDELLKELGMTSGAGTAAPEVQQLFVHDRIFLDEEGRQTGLRSRGVMAAQRQGVHRVVISFDTEDDPLCDIDRVDVRALEGCRLGRVQRRADSNLLVAELLFDRRLGIGDVHVAAHEVVIPEPVARCPGSFRTMRISSGPHLVQMHFAGAMPAQCLREYHAPGDETPRVSEELAIDRGGVASAWFPSAEPGTVGIRLAWND